MQLTIYWGKNIDIIIEDDIMVPIGGVYEKKNYTKFNRVDDI